ncbi:response regulator [Shewanella sp. SR43-4]|uniref:HD domain-containing phosphohydrolase n=1 Tax=Shewanella TaxID=22 RepID=UPI00140538C2|nr:MULTISPECIES: HD domain-containing phosphohydrolase [Shewanella]MBB1317161.1 response regulator [Shewanella sp. SR43-4]MBB1391733.1 response regulator [Shewanella sp. SG44-6]MBB1476332.1 response regulator [Shewanella sp. SG41-3]UJL43701.1 response regulator [Shewanella vesiculosa]
MSSLETSMPIILCVDDETSILKSLQRLFMSSKVKLLLSSSGQQALELMQTEKVNIIISDMRMPNMTGAEFLAQAAVLQPDAYRILMTGYSDIQSTVSAINVGKIHRYIQKPWDNAELLAQVHEGLEIYRLVEANKLLTKKITLQNKQLKQLNNNLEEMVQQRTTQLKKTLYQYKLLASTRGNEQKATLEVLYNLISINPALNGKFALQVSETCGHIATALKMNKAHVELISKAGLYCELGKLGLPAHCLTGPYDQLSSAAQKRFFQHPQLAEEMLAPAVHLSTMSEIIGSQYEHYNGTGEPLQKVAQNIHIGARILAVARDFWLALFEQQNAKDHTKDLTKEEIYKHIKLQQGNVYDPKVVNVLGQIITAYQDQETINHSDAQLDDGLLIEQITEGMRLTQNLYNRKHMLLLPKGHVFCEKTLQNLYRYQTKNNEKLLIKAERVEQTDTQEE